jgi:serine/threonine protein kinase
MAYTNLMTPQQHSHQLPLQVMESEASTAGTATFIGTPHYLSPEIFGGGTFISKDET